MQTPTYPQAGSFKGSWFTIAPGADLDYRLSEHVSVRADYEYQFLPSFNGGPRLNNSGQLVQGGGGLSPNGFSFGMAWKLLGASGR